MEKPPTKSTKHKTYCNETAKYSDKEKILKAARQKKIVTCKGNPIR